MDAKNQSDKQQGAVTEEQAAAEVMKYADKVSRTEVVDTVKKEGKITAFFACVDRLAQYADNIKLAFSMLKDFVSGSYTQVPWRTIASLVGLIEYVVTPIDLIPDFIPIIGWTDDCFALAAILRFVENDLIAYKEWKEVGGHTPNFPIKSGVWGLVGWV